MKKTFLNALGFFTVLSSVIFIQSCNKDDSETASIVISDFSPKKDTIGATVTITGSHFDAIAANNQILFNGVPANVKTATPTQLVVTVPTGASTGKISITLAGKGAVLTESDFQVWKTASKLYFSEYTPETVKYMSLNATGTSTTIANNTDQSLSNATGIVISASGYVYIAEEGGDRILRMKKDGSGTLEIMFDTEDGINEPTSIAINDATNTLYWNNSGTDQIMKGNADGTGTPSTLFDGADINPYGYGMAIDVANNKIYFSDFDLDGFIKVGKLDGTGTPTILYDENNATDFDAPSNIAIDTENGKIYWADEGNGNIVAANLDGTGTPVILFNSDDDVTSADGLAIDLAKRKIFWSNNSKSVITVGNIDGSGTPVDILTDVEPYYFCLDYK